MEYSSFEKALVLIPKATGMLSMIGSGWIIYHIRQSPKRQRLVYHRLLMGMSLTDLISSFVLFLSSWSIPAGTDIYLASGTTATCTAHGMFAQAAAIATPSYNAMLCLYYVLVVNWEYSESRMKSMEVYFHSWPLLLGIGTGISGLPLTLYNPAGFHCWISGLPAGCDQDDSVLCERGEYSWIFRWAFFYAWIWLYFVVIAVSISTVYYTVLKQERKMKNRYSQTYVQQEASDCRRSRRVAHQALLYVGAYYLTFLFGTITRSMQLAGATIPQPIYLCFVIFYPLQGFFNAIVYTLPRYDRWRRTHPEERAFHFFLSNEGSVRFFNSSNQRNGSSGRRSRNSMSSDWTLPAGRQSPGTSQTTRFTTSLEPVISEEQENPLWHRTSPGGLPKIDESAPTSGSQNHHGQQSSCVGRDQSPDLNENEVNTTTQSSEVAQPKVESDVPNEHVKTIVSSSTTASNDHDRRGEDTAAHPSATVLTALLQLADITEA